MCDCAGKELFSDFVNDFVSTQPLSDLFTRLTQCPSCSGTTPEES